MFSISSAASIGKARVGPIAWAEQYTDIAGNILELTITFLFALATAAAIIFIARKHLAKIAKIDADILRIILPIYIASITFLINGPIGLVVLGLGVLIGTIAIRLDVERTMLMGSIILPTVMVLFGIFI